MRVASEVSNKSDKVNRNTQIHNVNQKIVVQDTAI